MNGKKLSVTGLGCAICNQTKTKHNIKRADRLIGRAAMHQDRSVIYKAMATHMIGAQRRPAIHIDWSDLSADREFHLLWVSIPVDGRALTLYEESHHQRHNGNPQVHKRFLMRLNAILPDHCHPIVVTDAGFRTPWFRAIEEMGWDFVGRVDGHMMLSAPGEEEWIRVEEVFEMATTRRRYLGEIDLLRNNSLRCHAYLLKNSKQGCIKKTVFGERCAMKYSERNVHRERTTWLLVASLDKRYANISQIFHLYKTRTKIEEGFRDIKISRWGFAVNEARRTTTCRYENLLLVAHLTTFAVWLIGKIAGLKQWHRHYQANTVKTEKVLSTFFLGLEVIKRGADDFLKSEFIEAMRQLQLQHSESCGYV